MYYVQTLGYSNKIYAQGLHSEVACSCTPLLPWNSNTFIGQDLCIEIRADKFIFSCLHLEEIP